jgi:indole-3-glycerol phosphate synthase
MLARMLTALPLLRKDFIVDEYQLIEARAYGADAVLLIVAALSEKQLTNLLLQAQKLSLDCVVEAHTKAELDIALNSGAQIIGINNRNLYTFQTTLETTAELARHIPPDRIVVSESGINTKEDIVRLAACGVNAVLVGEALMRSPFPGQMLRELAGDAS